MCGISGFTFKDEGLIKKMNHAIRHRGPDDEGIFVTNDVSLGHRRLSILDLSPAGHQPMSSEKGTLTLVHNGEIYNFREIRKELEGRGYGFKSQSDTEVILNAYDEWGYGCLEKFRGMFAFALWDEGKKELFIARDRLGVKPLYYMEKGEQLFFSSEIKAFSSTGKLTDSLDNAAINLYFSFRFTPGSQTVLKDVNKLEPGHFMVWKNGKVLIKKYWDIELDEDYTARRPISRKSEAEYVGEFLDIFRESIKLRLVSDVPVGAYLSGGLDSSFIVGMMAGVAKKAVSTFSVGFPDGADESPYAQLVADQFSTKHHLLNVNSKAVDVLPDVYWHLDEPLSDAAAIPTYLMSQVTKKSVTVVLSGEGADEQLGGYDKYKALYYPHLFKSINPAFLSRAFSGHSGKNPKLFRAMEYLGNLDDASQAYLRFNSVFLREERQMLFSDEKLKLESLGDGDLAVVNPYLNRKGEFLNRLLLLDLKTWLPDDLLLKNDKMTMAHAVEARTPFLDHKLVEFLIKVPQSMKLKWFQEKYLLRKAMKGIVPEQILKRKKQGFSVPVHRWINEELKEIVNELFSKQNLENLGLFNVEYARSLIQKDLRNPYCLRQFWSVFSFLAWHRFFLKRCR
ncbi:MAG: asparagine synthase (glutamine-hydrolyzing) [Proteobacteria bacterium]|nr:asparagine synthase (glutamine-hydrolyzing) [Pseudomonadota bacterium]